MCSKATCEDQGGKKEGGRIMKMKEIRQMTSEELIHQLDILKNDAFKTKFKRYTENPEDVTKLRRIKRDIARVKTALRELELGIYKDKYIGLNEE